MEKTGTVLPCPKCGSGFLAWGKPFRSATPKLVVLLGRHRRIVCCVMCGYYAGIPNVAGSTAYTSNWVAELFGPSNLKKSTSGFPQRLYNSVLQGALGIDKDGIFGANTEKTVKEFQSAHGLTADGIAGAKTKVALAKLL